MNAANPKLIIANARYFRVFLNTSTWDRTQPELRPALRTKPLFPKCPSPLARSGFDSYLRQDEWASATPATADAITLLVQSERPDCRSCVRPECHEVSGSCARACCPGPSDTTRTQTITNKMWVLPLRLICSCSGCEADGSNRLFLHKSLSDKVRWR
jgi:hypothetical protein